MDIKQIRELAEIVSQNGLTKLEIKEDNLEIIINKEDAKTIATQNNYTPVMPTVQDASVAATPSTDATQKAETENDIVNFNRMIEVKAPIVGVYYAAPGPDADTFVTFGTKVKKGDVLCIIEAMKLMNEITAECDGEIVDICVANGEVVEYGQTLFKIC